MSTRRHVEWRYDDYEERLAYALKVEQRCTEAAWAAWCRFSDSDYLNEEVYLGSMRTARLTRQRALDNMDFVLDIKKGAQR